ncbi:MAG: FkbM family methyltransferase [Bacteroidales bacterium]
MNFFFEIYLELFGRASFRRLNYFFLKLGMKGLGFQNYQNFKISGEKSFLTRSLRKFKVDTIFDVGANLGNYTLLLSENFKKSKIYCFEPHPNNFDKLNKNLSNTQNVSTYNIGFSDSNMETVLFDYANKGGSSHATLYEATITEIIQSRAEAISVKMQTIDNFLASHPEIENISFLKIDTEGNEYKILLGAKDALHNNKINIIQFEIGVNNIISKVHFKDFIDILNNYNLYRLLPKDLLKITYNLKHVDEILAFQNIIAIRKDLDLKE